MVHNELHIHNGMNVIYSQVWKGINVIQNFQMAETTLYLVWHLFHLILN